MAWSNGGKRRSSSSSQHQPDAAWLLNLSITALSAAALVVIGHWFSKRRGRCLGGSGRRDIPDEVEINDNEGGIPGKSQNMTGSKYKQPMNLTELRLWRLKAAEARSHRASDEPSATRLTPLGVILSLARKVDKLEEEASSLLELVAGSVISPSEEKEQARLLELLAKVQLDLDGIQGDESVRPHRRLQTNRIQSLITKLDQLTVMNTSLELNPC